MATRWPASRQLEREGDREYIAPEVLSRHAYDKPADIFSLGLILLEVAGNIQLPDNGASWQKLRSGDLSEIPELTTVALQGIIRDDIGFPLTSAAHEDTVHGQDDLSFGSNESFNASTFFRHSRFSTNPNFIRSRSCDLAEPPLFIQDDCLETMVAALIAPNPVNRFTASQILLTQQLQWVLQQRKAGAIVYEGEWGQAVPEMDLADMMECSQQSQNRTSFQDSDDSMILED